MKAAGEAYRQASSSPARHLSRRSVCALTGDDVLIVPQTARTPKGNPMWFRTLFDSLKPRHSRMSVRRARRGPPLRQPAANRLAIETLEDRSMMAATSMASFAVSDATVIEGNDGIQYAAVSV